MAAKTASWRVSGHQLGLLKPAGPAFQSGDEYLATYPRHGHLSMTIRVQTSMGSAPGPD